MKKSLATLVILILVIALCSCAKNENTNNEKDENPTTSTESIQESKSELIYNSTDAFDYFDTGAGVVITYFKNYDYVEYDKIVIPKTIDGKTVVGIGALEKTDTYYGKVFSAIFGKCEVVIPETITFIGGKAFQDAKGLVKLSGGDNCKTIGEYAFMNCENLSEITFIDDVTDLADNAFAGCTQWNLTH